MGDLVKISLSEITATLEKLERRDILPEHLQRLRKHSSVLDGVEKALKTPVAVEFALEPIPGCERLRHLNLQEELLIREWEKYENTRLPNFSRLQKVHVVEFGESTTPVQAHIWLRTNGFKPAGIGDVAVFGCQGFSDIEYGVIGTATQSKPPAGIYHRYAPFYRGSLVAGKKPEIGRMNLARLLNGREWRYLAIAGA
ncbi:MAG TPA: hypothetical protein VMR75_00270 [Candidatus Saccharimonadales bacterium]|nr:hypothetical protein [Candidatus Saccharimonadales bacterium]